MAVHLERRRTDVPVDDLGGAGDGRKHEHEAKGAQEGHEPGSTVHASLIGPEARSDIAQPG